MYASSPAIWHEVGAANARSHDRSAQDGVRATPWIVLKYASDIVLVSEALIMSGQLP
jgi:hypothetical protein